MITYVSAQFISCYFSTDTVPLNKNARFLSFKLINQAKNVSVLVLGGWYGWKPAMLVQLDGQQEEAKCFERDDTTEVSESCSVNWQNQLFIFGGRNEKRQISQLTGQKLKRVGDLTFDHHEASCTVMASKYIYLCFSAADTKRCRRSIGPLKQFSDIAISTHRHGAIQISCSDSK